MLKEELTRISIPLDDAVAVIKEKYPGFDKPLLSKSCNPDRYGIHLRKEAFSAVAKAYPEFDVYAAKGKKAKTFNHKLKCRISCRLEDDTYNMLQQLTKGDHYSTMQDWIADQVRRYIAEKRGER